MPNLSYLGNKRKGINKLLKRQTCLGFFVLFLAGLFLALPQMGDFPLGVQQANAAPVNWGIDVQNASQTTSGHSRAMGGTSPNLADIKIKSVSIYLGAQTGDAHGAHGHQITAIGAR